MWDPDDGSDDDDGRGDAGISVKQPAGAILAATTSSASGYAGDHDEVIPREHQHKQVVDASEIVRRRQEARRQAAAILKEEKQAKARRLRALEPQVNSCSILS